MPLSPFYKNIRAKVGNDLLLIPGVCGLVFSDRNEILLQQRTDSGRWGLPGGMLDPGEEPAAALVREMFEETSLRVHPERITGVYLTRIIHFPNGDRSQFIITAFRCRVIEGVPRVNDEESLDVRYFPLDALPEIHNDHLTRIQHALGDGPAFFAPHVPKDPA